MNSYEEETQQDTKTKAYLSFKTQKGEDITYTSLFNSFNPNHEYESHNRKIRDKINRPTDKYHRLGNLKAGEWASVENQYAEIGMFDFTIRGGGKIQSPEDIAFIFRSLESQSVEHAFAVFTNEKKQPFVQWLSMGGVSGTVIDPKLLADAAVRFEAEDIYFVHNHPAGTLKASKADKAILGRMKSAFEPFDISIHGVILNLNSGHYLLFQDTPEEENVRRPSFSDTQEQRPLSIYSFSKRTFLNSPLDTRITSSKQVATFLSQQRFAGGEKRGYLLLNRANDVIGNFFATERDVDPSVKEMATLASRYGATNIIAYGNDMQREAKHYNQIKDKLNNFDISLLDVIEIEASRYVQNTHSHYTSLADEGILAEPYGAYRDEESFQEIKNQIIENNWYGKEQKIADDLLNAIKNNDKNKVNDYFKYGDSVSKIIPNLNEYNHGLNFGFTDLKFNEYGWIEHNAQWTNREEFFFDKPKRLPSGENAVEIAMGRNNKWTFANQFSTGNGGGGGPISVFNEPFNTKKDALNAGIKWLEHWHQEIVDSPYREKRDRQISEQMLHTLKDYREKQNQLSLFGNQNTEIENKTMDIEEPKLQDLKEKNIHFLSKQLLYLGFKDSSMDNLREEVHRGQTTFNLTVKKEFNGYPMKYALHFDKSKQSDMYFLNSYKAMMENGREQSIYLNKGKGFTAKETFNMMQGRAVFKQMKNKKDGIKYHAWIKLSKAQKGKDVKDSRNLHIYNENYGYNLNKSLLQHPIKELDNPVEKQNLIQSLQKGNRQAVTFKNAGREERKFIEANPQFKSLQVYDSNGKRAFVNPKKTVAVDSDNKNHSAHNKKTNNAPKRQTASRVKR